MNLNSQDGRRGFRGLVLLAGILALLAWGLVPAVSGRFQEKSPDAELSGQQFSGKTAAKEEGVASRAGILLGGMEAGGMQVLWGGLGALAGMALLAWTLVRSRGVNAIDVPGFEIITSSEARKFVPLEEKFQQMDYIAKVKTHGALRLSANLNKVNLSFRRYGYLLEDKNFRNALLVNRRRVRRTLLRDGDVLDLGDLTLLYRDNREVPIIRHSPVTPAEGKVQIKFDRVRGPVRKGTPMLVSEQSGNRSFYITKNIVFIGRSENNDLIIKSKGVDYRHAKIERVGSRYKFLDLSGTGNTYVNKRRVEQRILRDGDEIMVDNQRFKFQLASKYIKESAQPNFTPRDSGEDQSEGREEESGQEEDLPRGAEKSPADSRQGSGANG